MNSASATELTLGTEPRRPPVENGVGGIYRLTNRVMGYDWGSTTAIPALLGREPDGSPQAEMWIGSHPAAPSVTTDRSGCRVPLDELLRSAPRALLGALAKSTGSPQLPFLLKVLAAVRPLSIQVHPDARRAAERFADEQRADTTAAGPRLYADPWHKPELLYALEPFEALCGFRRASEAAALLRTLAIPALAPALAALQAPDEAAGIRGATGKLLALPRRVVAAAVTAAARYGHPAFRTVVELAGFHPADPGVLVSLLLHRLTVRPGEALFVPPRTVHSYIRGVGVEVMATSDNVLRAGLTTKRVAVDELLTVADFAPSQPQLVEPESTDRREQVFAPDAREFRFSLLRVASGDRHRWFGGTPRTVLCLAGRCTVRSARDSVVVEQGESVFLSAAAGAVSVRGAGVLATAETGRR